MGRDSFRRGSLFIIAALSLRFIILSHFAHSKQLILILFLQANDFLVKIFDFGLQLILELVRTNDLWLIPGFHVSLDILRIMVQIVNSLNFGGHCFLRNLSHPSVRFHKIIVKVLLRHYIKLSNIAYAFQGILMGSF